MVSMGRLVLGLVPFFNDPALEKSIEEGRTPIPLAQLAGVSDIFAIPFLSTILKIFLTPNFAPPDWFPVFPFRIENKLIPSPESWVGDKNTKPIDPRQDPFYHPDISTYKDKKNGEVLNIREVGLNIIWAAAKTAYQISYRTQSTLGWPQADVTTVMIPYNPNGKVVSYQMFEDATSLQCSPSYSLVTGLSDPTMDLLLLLGYIVNTPDHEGVNSSYVAGIKEGQSTLDSIRAFLSAREQIGLDTNSFDKIVMWGYSGGAIATGHAAESQPTYAPELKDNLVGAVAGGYIANITQVVTTINGGVFSGFSVAGIYGLGTEYPSIQEVIDESVRPGIRWRFNQVGQTCVTETLINYLFQNFWSYTHDKTGKSIINDERVSGPLQKEWMGYHAAPDIPVMIYEGVQDEIVDIHVIDGVVDYYCKHGSHVDYYRLGLTAHVSTEILSLVDALLYIAKLFDGYVPGPCKDYVEATKVSKTYFSPDTNQWDNIVYGKWQDTGILDIAGIRPSS